MISTIFEKNRLERLLKPINGKLVPSFMIETRQELGSYTSLRDLRAHLQNVDGRSEMGSSLSKCFHTSAHSSGQVLTW